MNCYKAFGGTNELFSMLQLPEPGFTGIVEMFHIPQVVILEKSNDA